MKIDIKVIVEDGKERVAGWDLIPETQEDEDKICLMRDAIFWGWQDNRIEYAGRRGNEFNENWPIDMLMWRKKKYHNDTDEQKLKSWEPEPTIQEQINSGN